MAAFPPDKRERERERDSLCAKWDANARASPRTGQAQNNLSNESATFSPPPPTLPFFFSKSPLSLYARARRARPLQLYARPHVAPHFLPFHAHTHGEGGLITTLNSLSLSVSPKFDFNALSLFYAQSSYFNTLVGVCVLVTLANIKLRARVHIICKSNKFMSVYIEQFPPFFILLLLSLL